MIKINGQLFANLVFYNQEAIYKGVDLRSDSNEIEIKFEKNCDITNLLIAERYIRDKQPDAKLVLKMLYIPYERTDREIPEGNQLFSLKYFAELVNNAKFDEVIVLDPHSIISVNQLEDDGRELLKHVNKEKAIKMLRGLVNKVVDDFKPDLIMYPDKGAYLKYPEILKIDNIKSFYGSKTRDLANKGSIIQYEVKGINDEDLKGKKVLIIDDLVSVGGTAYLAAKQIKLLGVSEVALYISHCENGIFYGNLLKPEAVSPKDSESSEKDLPWAGGYTVDRVYTAGTTPLENSGDNLYLVEFE